MNRIKKLIGMGWSTPIIRTAIQAGVVVLVSAGLGWVDVEVWKTAGLAAGAAILAKIQELSRS